MHVYVPENFKKMLLNFGKHNEVEVLLGVLQGGLNNPDIQLPSFNYTLNLLIAIYITYELMAEKISTQ